MENEIVDAVIVGFTPNNVYQSKGVMRLGYMINRLTKSVIRNLDKMISEGTLVVYDTYTPNAHSHPVGKVTKLQLKKHNKTNTLSVELYNDPDLYFEFELCYTGYLLNKWYVRRSNRGFKRPPVEFNCFSLKPDLSTKHYFASKEMK